MENVKARIYYVDNQMGDDLASGLSPTAAFKSLDAVNNRIFEAGDQIVFRAGQVFKGGLKLQGKDMKDTPICINSYTVEGQEVKIGEGPKPIIDGEGKVLYAVLLHNVAFWEICNIEVTNHGNQPLKGRTGIMISADNNFESTSGGFVEHIYLRNVFVHDVNGEPTVKDNDNGGIFYCILSEDINNPLVFKDILIEGCHVKNVHRTGISFGGSKCTPAIIGDDLSLWKDEDIKKYLHQDVIIRNNYIECAGGDAIVPMYSYRPLIEHNTSQEASIDTMHNPALMFNAAIWPWQCYKAVFQYNEAFRTYLNGDGQAYDCDWSFGTLYQHNYSHDNEGGFMLVCQRNAIESKIEHNISYNDQRCLFMTSNVKPAYVTNNTFYIGAHLQTYMFSIHQGPVVFNQNVFYKEGDKLQVDWHLGVNSYAYNQYRGFADAPESIYSLEETLLTEVLALAKLQKEIPDETDELALDTAWQNENKRRKTYLDQGKIIYGCKSYTKEQYRAYVVSNRLILKCQEIISSGKISDEQVNTYYDTFKERRYQNADSGLPFPKEMVRDHIRYEIAKEMLNR